MRVVYRQFAPSAPLRPFVERLWFLQGPASAVGAEPIPPDGRPEIIVHGGAPYAERRPDGVLHVQSRTLFAGQLTRAIAIVPRGHARMVGAQLRPHGAFDLLRVPQHPFTDRVVDLAAIAPALAQTLNETVVNQTQAETMVARLEAALLPLARSAGAPARPADAVAVALSLKGLIDVHQLARATGVSPRQLERLFRERIGIPPKLFLRIIRFQEVLRAARHRKPAPGWADVAVRCGFYDQAHFINDFKAFVGRTPASWHVDEDSLAAIFSAVRRRVFPRPDSGRSSTLRA
jgi:AraC-like DNA-binding protein